jgi:hypothetical protein
MAVAALAVAGALAAGCGDDGARVSTSAPARSEPAATVTTAESTPRTTTTEVGGGTATIPGTTVTVPGTTPQTTPAPGAGEEEAARVPAVFEIGKSGVTPAVVKVPAFLSIELTGVSKDGKQHLLGLSAGTDYAIAIPAGGRASKVVPGLRPGTFRVLVDGVETAARLKVGDEPGP